MASTYLQLVNEVLRDMNEVELTTATFASSRGVQTTVKDYVNRAIADIINSDLNWPFTHAKGSVDVIAGKALYSHASIATTLKYVDYDNMFLQPKNYITNGTYEVDGSSSIAGWTTVGGTPAASTKKRLVSVTQSKTKGASAGLILARAFLGSKQPLNLQAVSTPPPSIARWPRFGMMRMGYLKKQLTAANRSEVLPKPARGAEERYAAVTGLHKTQNIKKTK